jgi:hypothetical protein
VLIQVNYPGNRFDYVHDSMLHDLIDSRKIVGFMRCTGWVTIGVDPLRKTKRPSSSGRNKIVQVLYYDDKYDYVSDWKLDDLIRSNRIAKFKRKDGWVTIGVDPVRLTKRVQNSWHHPTVSQSSSTISEWSPLCL